MEEVATVGEILEVDAGGAVAGGRCLARHEGKVVLVAGALPGERVRVRITRDEKRWAEADVVDVLAPRAGRRTPPCPHAADCGGCDFQHASREVQLAMKRDIVVDAFRRVARLDVTALLQGPRAIGEEFRGRNRISLSYAPIGRPGLKRRGSHHVVPIDGCLQMPEAFDDIVLPWLRMQPPWQRATARMSEGNRTAILFETGEPPNARDRKRLGKIAQESPRPPEIIGLLADANSLAGERELRYVVKGRTLTADTTSFFQGTTAGAEELVDTVDEFLGEDRAGLLLDVYAGVGLFCVCVGEKFERVVAGEADGRAVRHLARNLKAARIRGEARAERADYTIAAVPRAERETVILDPPRVGVAKEAMRSLVVRAPRRIVSVSCDAATGARDVGALVLAGWRLERLRAIDLFPTTAHVETVALLIRGSDS
jgi:tRNA/tmRNA/rRNA uracil-C5-methylase (TrmA/RlmC/RlmD family)